jgi:uncharacterized protein YceK
LLGVSAVILLSLTGCTAIHVRTSSFHQKKYAPPYMGVKHSLRVFKVKDGMMGLVALDFPFTCVFETFLLPVDLTYILLNPESGNDSNDLFNDY